MRKELLMLLLLFLTCNVALAQSWMTGYSYRKKITIDKSKVVALNVPSGSTVVKQDLPNFPVLVQIQSDDLAYVPGLCSNKIINPEGKDISFALSTSPTNPLNFQIENYEAETGKLTCWVKIPLLSASGTSSTTTSFYLYYGSTLLHNPLGPSALNVWSGDFSRIWHFKKDQAPAVSADASSGISVQAATGSAGMAEGNFDDGKIGKGISLNGSSEYFSSALENSTTVHFSAWIKPNVVAQEQVIVANDSVNGEFRNGYVFKITAAGKLSMEFYSSKTITKATSVIGLEPNQWQHIVGAVSETQFLFYLNGVKITSVTLGRLGAGGSVSIGKSKQNTAYFSGMIDELRIQKTAKAQEWIKTEYVNQDNPTAFYSIGEEEYLATEFWKFAGTVNNSWHVAANWTNGTVPPAGKNIIIPTGKSVRLSGTSSTFIGQLDIGAGASLVLNTNLSAACLVHIANGGSIKIDNGVQLKCTDHLINDGTISLNQTTGTLIFEGNKPSQVFSGNGLCTVYGLENSQSLKNNILSLQSPIRITGYIQLKKGVLNSDGHLTLASEASGSASLLPIDVAEASLMGDVKVEHYLSGNYTAPASGRGWRLLASPVYHDAGSRYNLFAFKSSMFVTGAGGDTNGFDPSPLNSGTIYRHDQSLTGSLAQKYIAIENTDVKISPGRGVYVFSRGSRTAVDAYENQIRQSPFSNPAPYKIIHTGQVYQGNLLMILNNQNLNAEGDGFNLLGNPYPADLVWGNLNKTNLSPFIWQYDPFNKDYRVSDAANTIIPSGTGFFVRVNNGYASGRLSFSEDAKYILGTQAVVNSISNKKTATLAYKDDHQTNLHSQDLKLTATLSRFPFNQQYILRFESNGNDGLDQNDAPKIGDGFINIAGITSQTDLAIEQRGAIDTTKSIAIYVKGWETGAYNLTVETSDELRKTADAILRDTYLKKEIRMSNTTETYHFNIDLSIPESQGRTRFSIRFSKSELLSDQRKNELITYPNPMKDKLYFRSEGNIYEHARVTFVNILGKIVDTRHIAITKEASFVDCVELPRGIYVVDVYPFGSKKALKRFKIIKE